MILDNSFTASYGTYSQEEVICHLNVVQTSCYPILLQFWQVLASEVKTQLLLVRPCMPQKHGAANMYDSEVLTQHVCASVQVVRYHYASLRDPLLCLQSGNVHCLHSVLAVRVSPEIRLCIKDQEGVTVVDVDIRIQALGRVLVVYFLKLISVICAETGIQINTMLHILESLSENGRLNQQYLKTIHFKAVQSHVKYVHTANWNAT